MKRKLIGILKNETVLIISFFLAIASCFLVSPDLLYLEYFDCNTLILLFCLMAVMAGFKELGLFQEAGNYLLRKISTQRGLVLTLVFLCFIGSMVITNDVALITFVPLAVLILEMANMNRCLFLVIVLMTIASNLGSMLTPIGNPQNLYLYSVSGLSLFQFLKIMLPYSLISAVLLVISVWIAFRKKTVSVVVPAPSGAVFRPKTLFYLFLFVLCLLTVAKLLPATILLPIIILALLGANPRLLLKVDYSLLLTFACLFLFIGNMGRFPPFRQVIQQILSGHVIAVSVGISQIISNVPAALLLSGFTQEWSSLIVGTNLGGLGTLIASMASLISYKQVTTHVPNQKSHYLVVFTLWNLLFLAVLCLASFLILQV